MGAWHRKPSLNFGPLATSKPNPRRDRGSRKSAVERRGGTASGRHGECANLWSMRRARIILVLVSLVSSPLALLARSEACAEACTKSCCVALHHTANGAGSGAASHCHSNHREPLARCCDEPTSNHALDYGFTILIPFSILPEVASIEAPAISRIAVASNVLISPSTFVSTPFEPPRA